MERTDLFGYIATGTVSLGVGYLLKVFEPASRLVFWNPHSFLFRVQLPAQANQAGNPQPPIHLQTNTLVVQNIGRKPAEKIEIIHRQRPDHFQFATATNYTEAFTPTGEHVIQIDTLGKREVLSLQLLAYVNAPVLVGVRSKDGAAKAITINIERNAPRWLRITMLTLAFLGAGTAAYGVAKSASYVWQYATSNQEAGKATEQEKAAPTIKAPK